MSARAWIDGRPGEAVPFDDRGLMYGDGLFETIVCRDGAPCFLGQHLARLAAGCAALGIAAPEAALLAAELRHAAALGADGVVRVVVTRGSSPERGYAPPAVARPRRIVVRYPLPAAVDAGAGIRACHSPVLAGLSPQLAGIKHLNRLENVLARAQLADTGCAEAVMSTVAGEVIGGTQSNLFAWLEGRLVTPPLAAAGVRGVMRGVVLREAPRLGLEVLERSLRPAELERATGIFFTNVRVGIWPVAELGAWRAGRDGREAAAALQACIAGLRD